MAQFLSGAGAEGVLFSALHGPATEAATGSGVTAEEHRAWANRAVRAVDQAFPDVQSKTWPLCERLLPHALVCAGWIETERLEFSGPARLLNQENFRPQLAFPHERCISKAESYLDDR